MSVDHGSAHVAVAEQLLDRPDVVAILKQVCRERVPERVAAGGLRDASALHGHAHGALEHGFVQMVAPTPAARGVGVEPRRREHPLPADLIGRPRVLALQGKRQFDAAGSVGEIAGVLGPHSLKLCGKRRHEPQRKHGHPIPGALAVAHHDLAALQIDVLHPQPAAFEQPQPGAVKAARP